MKKIKMKLFQTILKKIGSFIPVEVIAILLVVVIPVAGIMLASDKIGSLVAPKKADTSPSALSVTASPSPTPSPSPDNVLGESTQDSFKSFVEDPSPSPSAVLSTYNQTDSSLKIERCKSQAKSKRIEAEENLSREYAQSEPGIVEMAATQSNGETEAIALKYGYMTQSDVVRRTEVFEKLLSQGIAYDQAAEVADAEGDSYYVYIRSLHEWAVNELDKWQSVLESNMNKYENDVYQNCLG